MVAADLDKSIMGDYGYGVRNDEGRCFLDICKNQNLKICNTYFKKDREKVITYKSGGAETQIDFIVFRPKPGIKVVDCKVIPGKECLTQHRLVRADFVVQEYKKKKWKGQRRIKIWMLREEEARQDFERKLHEAMTSYDGDWVQLRGAIMQACEDVCGRTTGRRGKERETWWWNETVQEAIRQKKVAYKKWQKTKLEVDRMISRQKSNAAKRAVATAKRNSWELWSRDLRSSSGQRKMFKMAKQMRKDQVDVGGTNYINDETGNVRIVETEVVDRWKRYFQNLLNQENSNAIEELPTD